MSDLMIVIRWRAPNGSLCQNQQGYILEDGGTLPSAADLALDAAAIAEDVFSALEQVCSDTMQDVEVVVNEVTGYLNRRPILDQIAVGSWSFLGQQLATPLPSFNALSVTVPSAAGERPARNTLGGFTEIENDTEASPSASLLTAALAYGIDWVANKVGLASGLAYSPALISGVAQAAIPLLSEIVFGDDWDSQVSRKAGQGE